jgi:hypothetical protein
MLYMLNIRRYLSRREIRPLLRCRFYQGRIQALLDEQALSYGIRRSWLLGSFMVRELVHPFSHGTAIKLSLTIEETQDFTLGKCRIPPK